MKKLAVLVMILVLVIFGGGYFMGEYIIKYYEKVAQEFSNEFSPNSIKNEYKKEFFSIKTTSSVSIKKSFLAKALKIKEDELEDLNLTFITTTKYNPLSLIYGIKSDSYIEFDDEHKAKIKEVFGDEKPFLFTTTETFGGKQDINVKIAAINKDATTTSPMIISTKAQDGKVSEVKIKIDNIKIQDGEFDLVLDGFEYDLNWLTPVKLKKLEDVFKSDFKNKFDLKKFQVDDNKMMIKLDEISASSDTKIAQNMINSYGIVETKGIELGDGSKIYKFNSLNFKNSAKNIALEPYLKIVNLDMKNPDFLDEIPKITTDLLAANPEVEVSELSLKNEASKMAKLSFKVGTKGLNKDNVENVLESGLWQNMFLNGELKFDENFLGDLFTNDDKQPLLDSSLLVKDNDDLVLKFVLDSAKQDVIINDKVSAKEFFDDIDDVAN